MPHKHTRRERDLSKYDLPPTVIAKPLPVTFGLKKYAPSKKNLKATEAPMEDAQPKENRKRKRGDAEKNDAPRAFRRMMAIADGKKLRSGLDDGGFSASKKSKMAKLTLAQKEKAEEADGEAPDAAPEAGTPAATEGVHSAHQSAIPTIRPGERLSEFNQRVDATLPLVGSLVAKTAKTGKNPLGLKVKRTLKEKKMHRLYDEWRLQDKKFKERQQEAKEEAEERAFEEEEELGTSWATLLKNQGAISRKKKGQKQKADDPWAELARRGGEKQRGIPEVAKAPPELKAPQNKLVREAAVDVTNIPKSAGSLRQREELKGIRDGILASYRKMMDEKWQAART